MWFEACVLVSLCLTAFVGRDGKFHLLHGCFREVGKPSLQGTIPVTYQRCTRYFCFLPASPRLFRNTAESHTLRKAEELGKNLTMVSASCFMTAVRNLKQRRSRILVFVFLNGLLQIQRMNSTIPVERLSAMHETLGSIPSTKTK